MVGLLKPLALVLIAALELGGAFGSASATIDSIDSSAMILDIEVQVIVSASAVVAHMSFENDPALALPLLDRGNGTFGIRTELAPKNYVVVFEAVGSGEDVSPAVFLTDLGADFSTGEDAGTTSTTPDDGISAETRQFGWLALALAAASLSALAFWVLGGRDKSAVDDSRASGEDFALEGEDSSEEE
jgi:hypothetical protein